MYRDAVMAFIHAFEQHKVTFDACVPYVYERLGYLMHRCRQLQQLGERSQTRQLLDSELFKLVGVSVRCTDDRPLSILAAIIRHVLISGFRQQPFRASEPSFMNHKAGTQVSAAADGHSFLLVLDVRLNDLAREFPEHVSLLEMRYFARLGLLDTACELGIAADIVKRELRFAKALLASACRYQLGHAILGSETVSSYP